MKRDPGRWSFAIHRILLIHGVILTAGGIPLLYLGDEIGTLNDYTCLDDPSHACDSRWVHRPRAGWKKNEKRKDPHSIEWKIYEGLRSLITLRKAHDAFSGGNLEVIWTQNDHVLGFRRVHQENQVLIFANFSEARRTIPFHALQDYTSNIPERLHGLSPLPLHEDLNLVPLDFLVLC